MPTINSHTLFHFTKKISTLKKIMSNGLRYSYSLEKTDTETAIKQDIGYTRDSDEKLQENSLNGNRQTYVAIPMICFCDIPLLRIEKHCKKYGKFAIGLNKEIMADIYNNQLNPVWYLDSKNAFDFRANYSNINYYNQRDDYDLIQNKQFKDAFNNSNLTDGLNKLIKKKELNTETFFELLSKTSEQKSIVESLKRNLESKILANYILGYTKERRDNNTSYYDEREWRGLLPDDEDIAEWIWDIDKKSFDANKKDWNNSLGKNKEYGHMYLTSKLIDNTITHIIVDTNERIPTMIDYIMKTKKIFGSSDISINQRLLLISKITSFERINNDY